MTRIRTRIIPRDGGKLHNNANVQIAGTYPAFEDRCEDVPGFGNGDNQPLTVSHILRDGGRISWHSGKQPGDWVFDDYLSDTVRSSDAGFYSHELYSTPPNSEYAVTALRRTNPSRPYVDLGTLVAEMRDFPRLLRIAGQGLRRVANANLAYQFGWRPLFSDLAKLVGFQSSVDSRIRELASLRSGGLRRTIVLDRTSAIRRFNYLLQSQGIWHEPLITRITTQVVKAHVRWNSTSPLPETHDDMGALARRAVLGLTFDGSTAWELVPWSWLIDWYSNTGDYIAACRNIVGAEPTALSIMRHTRTVQSSRRGTFTSLGQPGKYTGVNTLVEVKTRAHATPRITASLPFLTGRQAGILASLAVARGR